MNRSRQAKTPRTTSKCGAWPAAAIRFRAEAHWDSAGVGHSRPRARGQDHRRALCLYWGLGAKLDALSSLHARCHTREHGLYRGASALPGELREPLRHRPVAQVQEDLFKCEGTTCGYPTAEVPVTNIYRDETWMPMPCHQAVRLHPCFRSEAGSYGRDVRGIIRQHQFQKVELVKFTRGAELRRTRQAHGRRRRHPAPPGSAVPAPWSCARAIRVLFAKTYDIEVWLPGQNAYKEISSVRTLKLSGPPRRHPFQEREEIGVRPHAERQRPAVAALGGDCRELQQKDGSVVIRKRCALTQRRSDPPMNFELIGHLSASVQTVWAKTRSRTAASRFSWSAIAAGAADRVLASEDSVPRSWPCARQGRTGGSGGALQLVRASAWWPPWFWVRRERHFFGSTAPPLSAQSPGAARSAAPDRLLDPFVSDPGARAGAGVGLYVASAASFWLGLIAVLLLLVSILLARVVALRWSG